MKPTLKKGLLKIDFAPFGQNASTPDLLGTINVQQRTKFDLDENDEIFEGYGRAATAYPYTQKAGYDAKTHTDKICTLTLENDYLRAVFLPGYGARLWKLYDKVSERDLLFTNDVLKPSNLAVRNAWFAGGVEWNISVIGHTPFTAEPLFAARTKLSDGTPVLRFYEYERIRAVTYQMDFWLEAQSPFLYCRMRIENTSANVTPMYWWSNIAVEETDGMRIAVPAYEAYTGEAETIYKTKIPLKNGCDVTYPQNIKRQIDYFFNVPPRAQKYIAALKKDGRGLLQFSSKRLQGRKLFNWGHTRASASWQALLSNTGKNYLEIQVGLGKTQYGCVPMPPHTAWEWLEAYGACEVSPSLLSLEHDEFVKCTDDIFAPFIKQQNLEAKLDDTRGMAKGRARLIEGVPQGSPYGAFANYCRKLYGEKPLPQQLNFGEVDASFAPWQTLLEKGYLPEADVNKAPPHYFADDVIFEALKKACKADNAPWNAFYHLGLHYYVRADYERARAALEAALSRADSAWARHALAAVLLKQGELEGAAQNAAAALKLKSDDLSLATDCMRILKAAKRADMALAAFDMLSEDVRQNGRMQFMYTDFISDADPKTAFERLCASNPPADVREGEDSVGELYKKLYKAVNGKKCARVPDKFKFRD